MTIAKPAIDPEKEEPPNGKDTAALSTDLDALVIVPNSETSKEVDLEHNAAAVSVEKRADSVSVDSTPAGEPATEEEIKTLFHVVDDIPLGVWLAAFVASMERFVWYGATGPMQNYLQHDRHSKIPGALGLEQATATLVMTSFMAFSYFTPLLGAVVADAWLGRFRTTFLSSIIVLVGALILFLTALPAAVQRDGTAAAGLGVCMLLFSLGCGGVRAAATPFIADQYTEMIPRIKIRKNGERVIANRELTISYIYNAYYWMVNIAGLAALGTTFLEKYVGFWAAYLPPVIAMAVGIIPLVLFRSKFVRNPPSGALVAKAAHALWLAAKGGFRMDSAKPEAQEADHKFIVPWDDRFIEELKLGLFACRILLLFPFHWLCLNQTFNNLISQAGQMVNSGVPNDAIKSTNPLTGIVFYPLVQKVVYPWLRRKQIRFRSCARITLGFSMLTAALAYAAGLQQLIYNAGPCYDAPLKCAASQGGRIPNQISMFLQIPIYSVGGMAEVFCLTTGTEHAYNQAPKSMRSIIQAVSLAMAGFGALLAMAFTPLAKDPHLVILYAVLAGILMAAAIAFYVCFHHIDKEEIELL